MSDITWTPAADQDVDWTPDTPTLALSRLSDVDTTGATDGDVLTYDGTEWTPEAPTGGSGLPDGGATGELLTKQSSTNGDADWESAEDLGLATDASILAADHRALFVIDPETEVDGTATEVQVIDAVSGEASGSPLPVSTLVTNGLTRVLIATPIGTSPTWDTSRVGIWDITASGPWTLVARPNGRQRIHVGRTVGSFGVNYQTITMRGANFVGQFGTVDLDEPSVLWEADQPIPHAHRVPLMCQRLFYGGGTEDWLDASDGTGLAATNMLDGLAVATGTVVWVTHAADSDQCGPWRIDGDPTVVPPFPIPDSAGLQEVTPDQILELTPVFVGNGARWGGTIWLTRLANGFRGRDLMPVRPNLAGHLVDGSDEVADEGVWDDETGAVWMRDTDSVTGQGFRRLTTSDVDGIGWSVISDQTLGSDTASISVDVTGYKAIRWRFVGRSTNNATAAVGLRATFNGDTGSNYSTAGAAVTTSIALGNISGSQTNTNRVGLIDADVSHVTGAWAVGGSMAVNQSSTSSVSPGSMARAPFLWQSTAAITSLQVFPASGSLAAGGRLIVEGM